MTRYHALAIATQYWKPGTDYLAAVAKAVEGHVQDDDFVVVSEKAVSTARGNIVDESEAKPGASARFLAGFWMRVVWGCFLGVVCGFGRRLLQRLRTYPLENGSRHKQVALERAGLRQALTFGSEGGIDGSNLPFSYVSLPLADSQAVAEAIRSRILQRTRKRVAVVIVDTDKTYSFGNFHFTPRPKPVPGIFYWGGVLAYVSGRALKLRRRPTPLAIAGEDLPAETALTIANIADRARGPGSGATVWDMAARFKVPATGVTWEMLERVHHKPVVIVRRA